MKLYVFLILSFFSMQNCAQKKVDLTKPQQQTTMEDNTHANNPYYSRTDKTKLNVSNEEWKKILPPEVYAIAREANTEYPFTGKFNDFDEVGEYYCAVCGNQLFRSTS